jgi:anti-sigma B factor antagonist
VEFLSDRTLMWATGEIDLLTAPRLSGEITAHLLDGAVGLAILDLRDLAFIDCRGAAVLIDAAMRARERGIELRVVPGPALRLLERHLGLRDLVRMHDEHG